MDASAACADALGQPPLERGLPVLIGELDVPGTARVLVGERRESLADGGEIGGRQQLLRVQHLRVGE